VCEFVHDDARIHPSWKSRNSAKVAISQLVGTVHAKRQNPASTRSRLRRRPSHQRATRRPFGKSAPRHPAAMPNGARPRRQRDRCRCARCPTSLPLSNRQRTGNLASADGTILRRGHHDCGSPQRPRATSRLSSAPPTARPRPHQGNQWSEGARFPLNGRGQRPTSATHFVGALNSIAVCAN
jgi:hypothetical protein